MSEETQEAVQDAPAVETPSVTVNDLVNVYAIIDLASKRGAFQAGELSAVGNTANRVKAFVDHVQAQNASADAEATDGAAEPAES
jgi:hypothetical protein